MDWNKPYAVPCMCENCKTDGFYFVEDMDTCHFVKCEHCGNETLHPVCQKCGLCSAIELPPEKRSFRWRCNECGQEYTLPNDFYQHSVKLYDKQNLPAEILPNTSDPPLYDQLHRFVYIYLAFSGLCIAVNILLAVFAENNFYHSMLLSDLFLPPLVLSITTIFVFAVVKKSPRITLTVLLFTLAGIATLTSLHMEYQTLYDWFHQPLQMTGVVQYVTSTQNNGAYHVELKLTSNQTEWQFTCNEDQYAFCKKLEKKMAVIEYAPKTKVVIRISGLDTDTQTNGEDPQS